MMENTKSFRIMVVKLLLLTATVCTSVLQAQETGAMRTVSGIVVDHSGTPLPGVSVIAKGTTTGTATDIKGKYSLNVPNESSTLRFSYIGMTPKEIAVENRSLIDIVMEDREVMEPAKPINLTERQSEKAKADNGFAFRMFKEVSKEEGVNAFFSPFSLNMALGMLYNGSSGNTRAEMIKGLGIADFSESEINAYYQKISQALLEIDPTTDLVIANSIWYRDKLPVKKNFIEIGKKYFDADVQAIDFNNRNAANRINDWCANKTNNRINHIIAGPIPDDMMMSLINALYFKSKWQLENRFDEEKTKLDDFTKTNQQKMRVQMMEQTTNLPYYADKQLQCVEIPYGNSAFSMLAILPAEKMNINQLIEHLSNVKWENIVNSMQEQKVWFKLPRFKIEHEFPLNKPIMNLGMKQIFNRSTANFTNIADAVLWVSGINQKTFVEVNEEGTEAVAVSAIMVVGYGVRLDKPNEPVRFFADRPFLFLIREKSTGVILFIGRIDEPYE